MRWCLYLKSARNNLAWNELSPSIKIPIGLWRDRDAIMVAPKGHGALYRPSAMVAGSSFSQPPPRPTTILHHTKLHTCIFRPLFMHFFLTRHTWAVSVSSFQLCPLDQPKNHDVPFGYTATTWSTWSCEASKCWTHTTGMDLDLGLDLLEPQVWWMFKVHVIQAPLGIDVQGQKCAHARLIRLLSGRAHALRREHCYHHPKESGKQCEGGTGSHRPY